MRRLVVNDIAVAAILTLACIAAIAFLGSGCSCDNSETVEGVIVEYEVSRGWGSTTTITFEDRTVLITKGSYFGDVQLGEEYKVIVHNDKIQSIEEI